MFDGIASFLAAGTGINLLYGMIVLPAVLAVLVLIVPRRAYPLQGGLFLLAVLANLILSAGVLAADDFTMLAPWAGFDINLALRVYGFSRFMLPVAACFIFLVGMYSVSFLKNKAYAGKFFFFYLVSVALVNGAFLANNLVVLLFFWEGLLATLFGMLVLLGRRNAHTAVKALVLNGTADLLLLLGVAITCYNANTAMMDAISALPVEGSGALGFACMMIGAVGKAGAMPFHSWIPDAAEDAPVPFMALLPMALEKMLGVYLLARLVLDFYALQPGSAMSMAMMIIGAVTIVLAVFMAVIQNDMKRALSYLAISQVGYIVLGLGTALPVGIVGGLFHMLNHATYKSCLFLSAGSVEQATGSTDLRQISGLGRLMPLTGLFFVIAALASAGVPPFNAFFSKELVFDAAMDSGMIFYVAAALGAFVNAAVLLKLGHTAFFGPLCLPDGVRREQVREIPGAMLLPVLVLAAACVLLGVANSVPLGVIQSLLGDKLAGADFVGWPDSLTLVAVSCAILLLAVLNHIIGCRATGDPVKALDHLHSVPGLHQVYNAAERHFFDPYDLLTSCVSVFAWICFCIDRAINWIYDVLLVRLVQFASVSLRNFNTGAVSSYMVWSFVGVAFLAVLFMLLI